MIKTRKIALIGSGEVAKHVLTSIFSKEIDNNHFLEIIVISFQLRHALGIVNDLLGIFPVKNIKIQASDSYYDIKNADIVIILVAARITQSQLGEAVKKNNIRELMSFLNYRAVLEVADKIKIFAPQALIMMVTNQVDFMTHVLFKALNAKNHNIVGFGSMLDSARFRQSLMNKLTRYFPIEKLTAYIVGYHNADMMVLSNSIRINNLSFSQVAALLGQDILNQHVKEALNETRDYGSNLIKLNKNNAPPAMGAGLLIARAILALCFKDVDKPLVEPFCVYIAKDSEMHSHYGISGIVSVPVVIQELGFSFEKDIIITAEEKAQLRIANNNFITTVNNNYKAMDFKLTRIQS